jgi:hypothetical protein
MAHHTANTTSRASLLKSRLADVGLYALSRGEYQIVMAVTRLIQGRGMSHV